MNCTIDVLAAMTLNFKFEDLLLLYKTQFPVLTKNEKETFYDKNGQIIFTTNRNYSGVGISRPEWNKVKGMISGTIESTISDDTMSGGSRERTIVYEAPFDKCNREEDYETAWAEFERRFATTKYTKNA